jgi:hypothetical protein
MRILIPTASKSTTPGHSPGIGHSSYIGQISAAEASVSSPAGNIQAEKKKNIPPSKRVN